MARISEEVKEYILRSLREHGELPRMKELKAHIWELYGYGITAEEVESILES